MGVGDPGRERYVTWDRWDAEHRALRDHEAAEIRRLDERDDDAAERITALEAAAKRTAERRWNLLMAFLAAVVFPLLLLAILAVVAALRTVP